jgi:hypothetical protein
MDKLILQSSKIGDIINILPLALHWSKQGHKVGIMACSEFSEILDGVSYVEKVVFDGKPWELERAHAEAIKICPNVISTTVNGPFEEVRKITYEPAGQANAVTDSFSREAWMLAKELQWWGAVPLVIDKRDAAREEALLPKNWRRAGLKKKICLLSLNSVSSPFPYAALVKEMLTLKFPKFHFIDLAEIRAERFYDLLGLYEIAHCLVTVDTGHLHLAAATPKLPVMALVQDEPTYWFGTAWRPQHVFHCRYHDFPRRALELFTAIEDAGLINCGVDEYSDDSLLVYFGGVREPNIYFGEMAIQPGSCFRDSSNVLGDSMRFPMLRNAIRMFLHNPLEREVWLACHDTIIDPKVFPTLIAGIVFPTVKQGPSYAYRMNRKNGADEFFPAIDLFAAQVSFWIKILPEVPDMVMDNTPVWAIALGEIFKKHGAKEIGGIYRYEN